MNTIDIAAFDAECHALGYDKVLDRTWQPGQVVGDHTHPFDARAVVTQGQMWLTVAGATRELGPGDRFELLRDTPHAERYGPQGATYRVGRRGPAA